MHHSFRLSVSNSSRLSLRVGSRSKQKRSKIGGLHCQYTATIFSGTVQWMSPNQSELGSWSAGRAAGPSVDLYNVPVFAVG